MWSLNVLPTDGTVRPRRNPFQNTLSMKNMFAAAQTHDWLLKHIFRLTHRTNFSSTVLCLRFPRLTLNALLRLLNLTLFRLPPQSLCWSHQPHSPATTHDYACQQNQYYVYPHEHNQHEHRQVQQGSFFTAVIAIREIACVPHDPPNYKGHGVETIDTLAISRK